MVRCLYVDVSHSCIVSNGQKNITLFLGSAAPSLSNSALQNSQGNHLSGGIKYAECRKLQFSDNISQYIRNDRKEGRSYYGTLIFNAPAEVALEFCDGGSRKKLGLPVCPYQMVARI